MVQQIKVLDAFPENLGTKVQSLKLSLKNGGRRELILTSTLTPLHMHTQINK